MQAATILTLLCREVDRVGLKGVAKETLKITQQGCYSVDGRVVELGPEVAQAIQGTVTYSPTEVASFTRAVGLPSASPAVFEVTPERTQEAAYRLAVDEGVGDLVLLNFASARNPGGGFLNGAKAQEEDLTRCSALYPCLKQATAYYEANRLESSLLYTDHVIYSPQVPFFRRKNRDLLPCPYQASVITAPAPNAGQVLRRDPNAHGAIEAALRHRAGGILGVARQHGHRTLLLGAWGCGVFMNDPEEVATAFDHWLAHRFRGSFDRVVFATYGPERNRVPFAGRFSNKPDR